MLIRCTSSFLISWLALYMGLAVPKTSSQQVVINEVVSSNQRGLLDPSGGTPDWIELFNPGPGVASLAGYALTDDPANPRKWILSSGTIPPGGFLLVFADGKDRQPSRFPARDPGTTPGLVSWIKASSVSTNDTTAVRRSGVLYFLKRWPDLSGAGNHWTQDSTSFQPFWLAPTNGLPAAFRFDGGNDTLLTSRSLASNNFCIIAVCRTRVPHEIDPQSPSGTAGTSGQRYFLGANHLGALDSGMGVSLGTNGAAIYEHGDGYMPPVASVSGNMAGYQLLAWHYSNGTPRIYWQGALSAEGLPSSRRHVAAPTSLGSGPYGAWSGDLAEMMIFNRALTPEELGGIQTHLLSEYQMPSREAWHANFSISSSGETLQWVSPQGIIADSATIPASLPSDVSLGRSPDGTGLLDRYFASPTPGASNSTPPSRELLEPVTFSHAAGYHTNTFLLTLSCATPGTTIRYTVDGSEPTQTSLLYQGPFAVTNRSRSPNNLSLIPTFPGGVIPSGVVYKFTVVRAKAFKPEGLPGRTSTRTFIVEPRGSSRFSLPVVSLISPRENFFDNNIGIYVPGNAPGGNYSQSGDAWERPGHVEFFEPDGTLGFSQGTGIRMHGNTSFQFPVKGLRLHALNHPGTGPFRHRIFPDHPVETFNRLLLRPSGHDYNLTMFRDVFMQSLGRELGLETQISRAALLFINGEYWGIHHCQEAFEPGYFAAHSPGTNPDAIDYLEGYAAAVNGDAGRWNEMMRFLETSGVRNPTNYSQLRTFMDPENFRDYKIAETYYYRWDIGNHRLWRPRTPEGRFRWILFDCDVGWGGFWGVPPAWSFPMLDYNLEANGPWTQYSQSPGGNDHNSPVVTYLLRTLVENAEFKRSFINRFADVMNTTFQSNRVIRRIDEYASQLAPEMREHVQRWQAPASMSEWSNNVRYLRQYAIQRPGFMRQHITNRFKLPGTVMVNLRSSDTNAGLIKLNTIETAGSLAAPWTGVYFRGHPITAAGAPKPGYKFVGWQELGGSTQSLELTPTNNLTLTGMFEADDAGNNRVPAPHLLRSSPFVLSRWERNRPAGTWPGHVALYQSREQDPLLSDAFDIPWILSYALDTRSRFVGLDESGLGFINTSEVHPGGGYSGAMVVGLNSTGMDRVEVRFTTGTVTPNSRSYTIRLQARAGDSGPFQDVRDPSGNVLDYLKSPIVGHEQHWGPIRLPDTLAGLNYFQLRWVYSYAGGDSGPRPFLRLDDIVIAESIRSQPPQLAAPTLNGNSLRIEGVASALAWLRVQDSVDLVTWKDVGSVQADGVGGFVTLVQLPPGMSRYFLRVEQDMK